MLAFMPEIDWEIQFTLSHQDHYHVTDVFQLHLILILKVIMYSWSYWVKLLVMAVVAFEIFEEE